MTFNRLAWVPEENISKSRALIFLTIALVALSLTAIFIKISVREISVNATLFNRLWLATLIFGAWSGLKQARTQVSEVQPVPQQGYEIRDIVLLLAVGIVHLLGRFCWTWSLTQTSAANANVLGSLTPIFTTLGGWLLFNQNFDRRFLIGMALAVVGASSLGLSDLLESTNSLTGDAVALTSSLFYAANFLIIEQIGQKFSVTTVLVWRCLIGTLLMIPLVLLFEEQIFPISWSGWVAVICLAAICEALGHGLVVYSLKHFSSGFVALFLLLDPVIVAILAWLIFSETLSFFNLLGLALILEGIYLAKTGKGSDKASEEEEDVGETKSSPIPVLAEDGEDLDITPQKK
jgi:drug/metabolite transporter (DMT)-like permease